MNQYSEQVLSAIDTLVDNKLSKLRYDKTIEAEITLIADIDSGEYKVKYQGNTFSAFANNVETQYKIGEKVYVVVPEGDFSNKKIISAKVSKQSLSQTQLTNLQNQIIETSPNLINLYNKDGITKSGVIAGIDPSQPHGQEILLVNEIKKNDTFTQYARNFDLIKIEAQFQTLLTDKHDEGNYGLKVDFYTIDPDTVVTYKLDIDTFNGYPYHFNNYTLQSNIVPIEKNYLTGIKSIILFQEDFKVDNGNIVEPNIFVKDIKVAFIERKDLSNISYYLTIQSPNGNIISSLTDIVNLKAQLIHQGNELSLDKAICTWYERDLSIMVGKDEYAAAAGPGWKKLESNKQEITLTKNDISYEKRYKLVVVYNNDIIVTAETEVWNLLNDYNYSIEQVTDGADIKLLLKNISGYGDLQGIWYISYPDGSYAQFSDNKKTIEITLKKEIFIYPSATFYCSVYDDEQLVGTAEHNIQIGNLDQDLTVYFQGLNVFRYDASGTIAIENADQEKVIEPILTWKDGLGDWCDITWIAPDGERIDWTEFNNRYSPKQSMMQDLWVDTYNNLHYNVRRKFRAGYLNNVVKLEITTVDGSKHIFEHEILFIKDGDQGTNGSSFVIQIAPYSLETGNKDTGYQGLFYDTITNRWKNPKQLKYTSFYSIMRQTRGTLISSAKSADIEEPAAIESVDIVVEPRNLTVGETVLLRVLVKTTDGGKVFEDNSLVNFKSNNVNVATVNSSGLVTAVGEGTVIISAIAKSGYVRDSVTITVKGYEPIPDLVITDEEVTTVGYTEGNSTIIDKSIQISSNPDLNLPEIEKRQNAKIALNDIIYRGSSSNSSNLIPYCSFKNIYRPYRCYVYKDGEQLNIVEKTSNDGLKTLQGQVGNKVYDIEFEWEAINLAIAEIKDSGISTKDYIAITGKTTSEIYDSRYEYDYNANDSFSPKLVEKALPYYIKVTVTIKDGDSVNTLTNLYPIDVYNSSILEIDEEAISYIFDLPNSIMYSPSGVTPTFKNSFIDTSDKYFESFSISTPDILDIESNDNNEWQLVPIQSYNHSPNYDSSMGIINAILNEAQSQWIQHTVIMYLNTYGNEAINSWDGVSVKINDDDENGYILAPQVGAGKKINGRFNGIAMGEDTSQKQIGLYGYQEGINTFGFKADGTGYIGPSNGGRIEFNGEKGIIKSGNYTSQTGMAIDLQNGKIQAHDLILQSANMTLDSVNQSFTFDLNNASVTSKFRISGKKVEYNKNTGKYEPTGNGIILFNISKDAYYLQSANFKHGKTETDGAGTYINLETGYIETNNAILRGTIQAREGNIGNWRIVDDGLSSTNGLVQLTSNGVISLGRGAFVVNQWGNLSIGEGNFEVDRNGNLIAGNGKFRVDTRGDVIANSLTIYPFNNNSGKFSQSASKYGILGDLYGQTFDNISTSNIGIRTFDEVGIIFESSRDGRFTVTENMYLDAYGGDNTTYEGNIMFRCKNILWSTDGINLTTLVEDGKIYAVFG